MPTMSSIVGILPYTVFYFCFIAFVYVYYSIIPEYKLIYILFSHIMVDPIMNLITMTYNSFEKKKYAFIVTRT